MQTSEEGDAIRDGLALIEAAHRGDLTAARVVLDNGNPRLIAAFLSRVAADMVEDFTEDPAEAFAWLRASRMNTGFG